VSAPGIRADLVDAARSALRAALEVERPGPRLAAALVKAERLLVAALGHEDYRIAKVEMQAQHGNAVELGLDGANREAAALVGLDARTSDADLDGFPVRVLRTWLGQRGATKLYGQPRAVVVEAVRRWKRRVEEIERGYEVARIAAAGELEPADDYACHWPSDTGEDLEGAIVDLMDRGEREVTLTFVKLPDEGEGFVVARYELGVTAHEIAAKLSEDHEARVAFRNGGVAQ